MITVKTLINDDGVLLYFPRYDNQHSLTSLIDGIIWRNDTITMFGKTHPQPRLTAWYGDHNIEYTYSRITMMSEYWTPALLDLKTKLEIDLNCKFNSVLINYYRDGDDHMSWHSDNEKSLGEAPLIASLSYGTERLFQLKHKRDVEKKIDIIVENGSLIVMKGSLQENWSHRIAKSKKIKAPRLNLTFRYVYQDKN
jgi:alkylated DNA repair dioxygenase AlkB